MREVFRIVKIGGFALFLSAVLGLLFGLIGSKNILYPTFGYGIIASYIILRITLTRGGMLYFSWLFRYMIIFCTCVMTIEQYDILFPIGENSMYNAILFTFGSLLLIYLINKIKWQKKR